MLWIGGSGQEMGRGDPWVERRGRAKASKGGAGEGGEDFDLGTAVGKRRREDRLAEANVPPREGFRVLPSRWVDERTPSLGVRPKQKDEALGTTRGYMRQLQKRSRLRGAMIWLMVRRW
jgi:hypothetical protein